MHSEPPGTQPDRERTDADVGLEDCNLRSSATMLEYGAIARRIAGDRPSNVLDWGCGFGQMSHLLAQAGLEVSAFDYQGEVERDGYYKLARHPEIEAYLSADPVKLPFEDASFDAVLSCGVLEHVADPPASLLEIRRVLRAGGTFYVYKLPNRYSYIERIAKRAGLYYHGSGPNDRLYTKRSVLELLERQGFRVGELRRANMLPLNRSGAAFSRAGGAIWTANRALSRVPGLNLVATNLELVATAPGSHP